MPVAEIPLPRNDGDNVKECSLQLRFGLTGNGLFKKGDDPLENAINAATAINH